MFFYVLLFIIDNDLDHQGDTDNLEKKNEKCVGDRRSN